MKEKCIVTLAAAAILSGSCLAVETPAATNAPAILAQLQSLREAKTLLCWPSFQPPYYQFVVRQSSDTQEMLKKWDETFDALAKHADGDAAFAEALFIEGNAATAALRDGEGLELVQKFHALGERIAGNTCKAICDRRPEFTVPFAKALIGGQTPVVFTSKGLKSLAAGPAATLTPAAIASLIHRLYETAGGNGDTKKALDAEIMAFLASPIPAEVRDSLIDTLLAASLERAQEDAKAVANLVADAKTLREKFPDATAQAAISQRIGAFGERMVERTFAALCEERTEDAIAYLQKIAAERVLYARFGKNPEFVSFTKDKFPPLSDKFVCRLITSGYARIANGKANSTAMRPLNALVTGIILHENPDNVPNNLLSTFLQCSSKRAMTDEESARMLFADADILLAGLKDAEKRSLVERQSRMFVRKSALKTFQAICPARPDDVVPYLRKLADTLTLRALYGNAFVDFKPGRATTVPADFIGQLAEEAIMRLSGSGTPDAANMNALNALIDFSASILPKLSKDAQQSMLDRRLDAFFITGNYDGAIALLEKGLPSHTAEWCKGTAAKLRYHQALKAGEKTEALKHLLAFMKFMQSDEQKDFEDCDPATGIVYSREWVLAKNFMRCAEISRELKDGTNETKYRISAGKMYAAALEKAKNDAKANAAIKKEMKAAGL